LPFSSWASSTSPPALRDSTVDIVASVAASAPADTASRTLIT
jgi:hypothetical protein